MYDFFSKASSFQEPVSQTKDGDIVERAASKPGDCKFSHPFKSELWFLGNRLSRAEEKVETVVNRLDTKIETTLQRATNFENTVLERVSSVETDFSSRVSRLEDRLASVLLLQSPDTHPGGCLSETDTERRLQNMTTAFRGLNESVIGLHENRLEDQLLAANLSDQLSKLKDAVASNLTRKMETLTTSCQTIKESIAGLEEKQNELNKSVTSVQPQTSPLTDICQNVSQALTEAQMVIKMMNSTIETLQEKQAQGAMVNNARYTD